MSRAEASTPESQHGQPKQHGNGHKRRNLSLASISIPSILRRKPLPPNSPIATQRSLSLDTPKTFAPQYSRPTLLTPIPSPGQAQFEVRDLDRHPHGTSPLIPGVTPTSLYSQDSPQKPRPHNRNISAPVPNSPRHERTISRLSGKVPLSGTSKDNIGRSISHTRSPTMTSFASQGSSLQLRIDSGDVVDTDEDVDPLSMPKTPKSPARKLSNFFGWKRSPGGDSPSTNFSSSSQPVSPMPVQNMNGYFAGPKLAPAALDIPRANAAASMSYFVQEPLSLPTPPASSNHIADLEQELREISAELASSIKREMELEDELERTQSDPHASVLETNRRTSDYYSDSGAGSVRYPLGDSEGKIEHLERLRRTTEQEKAQLKLEMSQKLQDAMQQRREAEERAQSFHERLQSQGSGIVDGDRVRELEAALEETRRKLAEERQFRQNFQDLVGGMRLEIEQHKNDRDNLRDEVVPQLRARIEGLESENAEAQSLTYEHSRMQQELQTMRDENQTLLNARRMQTEMQQQGARFRSITEEDTPSVPPSPSLGGLSRSKSFAAGRGGRASRSNSGTGGALGRAESVKGGQFESREALTQKVKDVESQRDALHKALKSLLERHIHQEKTHAKRVKTLEKERDSARNLTPRRTAFHDEVKFLRDEVSVLRRRADDALDQKWQCEKNLGGLKMDLDRAQQETGSLRALLQERDIFVPDRPGSRGGPDNGSTLSLDKAYTELRTTHALSIAHLKDIESGDGSLGMANADAERTLDLLKQSISDAEAERDRAQSQAEEYRQQARTLQKSELDHLSKEQSLASELYAHATRMDELANQVQTQLQSNSVLRQRLTEAIERGEREQKMSGAKISQMQGKLKELEDQLMVAQQHSEEYVNTHEEEVRQMQEGQNSQLKRKPSLLGPKSVPGTPLNPVFALKSPRIDRTTSGMGLSIGEASKTDALEKRVQELEKALSDADREMSEVVSRMNKAQMEVAELQSERDDAMMKTRKLQAEVLEEREKVKVLMS